MFHSDITSFFPPNLYSSMAAGMTGLPSTGSEVRQAPGTLFRASIGLLASSNALHTQGIDLTLGKRGSYFLTDSMTRDSNDITHPSIIPLPSTLPQKRHQTVYGQDSNTILNDTSKDEAQALDLQSPRRGYLEDKADVSQDNDRRLDQQQSPVTRSDSAVSTASSTLRNRSPSLETPPRPNVESENSRTKSGDLKFGIDRILSPGKNTTQGFSKPTSRKSSSPKSTPTTRPLSPIWPRFDISSTSDQASLMSQSITHDSNFSQFAIHNHHPRLSRLGGSLSHRLACGCVPGSSERCKAVMVVPGPHHPPHPSSVVPLPPSVPTQHPMLLSYGEQSRVISNQDFRQGSFPVLSSEGSPLHHHHHLRLHPQQQHQLNSTLSHHPGQSKRKRSWSRAVFSHLQRKGLEKRFEVQKYVTKPDRKQLAASLGLTDAQVKVWFQNRRMKWRHAEEAKRKPGDTQNEAEALAAGGNDGDRTERMSTSGDEDVALLTPIDHSDVEDDDDVDVGSDIVEGTASKIQRDIDMGH